MDEVIYHEKQFREFCAIHSLNNLFQTKLFEKSELDELCYNLMPNMFRNPHRSLFGLGNYDVNVIMLALKNHGHECIWFDKRRNVYDLDLRSIFGFIMNVPSNMNFGPLCLPVKRRHWICLRKIGPSYYNLDSKLPQPLYLGSTDKEFLDYLYKEMYGANSFNPFTLFTNLAKPVTSSFNYLLRESGLYNSKSSNETRAQVDDGKEEKFLLIIPHLHFSPEQIWKE